MTIQGEVASLEVWAAVETHFQEGVRVYENADFGQQLLEALRKENQELDRKVKSLEVAYRDVSMQNRTLRAGLTRLGGTGSS